MVACHSFSIILFCQQTFSLSIPSKLHIFIPHPEIYDCVGAFVSRPSLDLKSIPHYTFLEGCQYIDNSLHRHPRTVSPESLASTLDVSSLGCLFGYTWSPDFKISPILYIYHMLHSDLSAAKALRILLYRLWHPLPRDQVGRHTRIRRYNQINDQAKDP